MWTARDHDVVRPWTELPEPASSRRCLRPRSSTNRLARLEHGGEQGLFQAGGGIEPGEEHGLTFAGYFAFPLALAGGQFARHALIA